MNQNRFPVSVPLALVLVLAGALLFGQSEKGAIIGAVKDPAGAAVAGATVRVTRVETNVTQSYTTNAEGLYEAPFLSPGRYSVTASYAGFETAVVSDINLHVGERARADIALKVGGVETRVEVTAPEPLVQTDTASIGQVVDNKAIVELPNLDRNIYSFMLVNSNVTLPPGGNAGAFRLESAGSPSISGTRASSVTFKIDGLSNTDPAFGTPTLTPSLDGVQEFKLQNNAYDAQYEGIGQVNIATKSGTNQWHGSGFDFLRNDALQPRNPLAPRDRSGLPAKNKLRFNQFGGSFGGPVLIPKIYNGTNKTFFFFNYEGRRENTTGVGFAHVLTQQERNGDFSSSLQGACTTPRGSSTPVPALNADGTPSGDCVHVGQIFDPLTTTANPQFDASKPQSAYNPRFIRLPFAGNIIPQSRLNSVSQKVLGAAMPLPNNLGADPLSNFLGVSGLVWDYNQYSGRLDHEFSEKDRVYGRIAFQDNFRISQSLLPLNGVQLGNEGRVASATWTHLFSPSLVNEFRVGYVRGIYGFGVDHLDPKQFGIQNTFLQTLPTFTLSNASVGFGGFSASILAEVQNTYQISDNVSLNRGRHGFKFGFDISQNRFQNGEFGNGSNGRATFDGTYSVANSSLTGVGQNSIADYVMGLAQATSVNATSIANVRNTPWGAYFQDDWKVTPWMTMNLGLRYEYHQPYSENLLGGSTFDYAGGGHLVVANSAVAQLANSPLVVCCSEARPVPGHKKNFAPRVGIVIRPFKNDNLAVRMGYGIFYNDMTSFFAWRQYESLVVPVYNAPASDFQHPSATMDNLFPASAFTSSGVKPFFPSGVNRAVLNNQPILGNLSSLGTNSTPYAQQWSLSIQRAFWRDLLVEINYTGSNGKNLPTQWIFNQPTASPNPVDFKSTDPASNPYLRRPYTSFGLGAFSISNILQSSYNAGTIKVDKRFSKGVSFLSAYTFSKSLDEGSEVFALGVTFNIIGDNRNIRRDRGVSTFNVPQRWVTSGTFELPFGKGKALLNNTGKWDRLISGFQISPILTFQSGFPFTPLIRNRLAHTGYALSTERGDLVGNPYFSSSQWDQNIKAWENGSRLFLIDPKSINLDYAPGTFGNIPRNFFHTPFGRNLDLALAKNTQISERAMLTFRADVINISNERLHRLDLVSNVVANNALTNPLVGSIPNRAQLFNPRTIQLSLRLVF